ncbi:MAG TPA: S-methyl-5-thioribose-1-phosphate isomerase [Gemmatimonadaceae bacterium]
MIQPVSWSNDGHGVRILDQRVLPEQELYRDLRTVDEVYEAILNLAVRGAPAIGIAAAMGVTLSLDGTEIDRFEVGRKVRDAAARIGGARPTAVNLSWALGRMGRAIVEHRGDPATLHAALIDEATRILIEDREMCHRIGDHGSRLIKNGARILTHCNAGALATGGTGTALAAIYAAAEQGKKVEVYADETRPMLQGSRLTAWELIRAGIPVTVLIDSAAASLMKDGEIDLVIVGADRIAANGDTANKIGTYPLAIAAKHHGIPFYVAAPGSTFDPATRTGENILIEQRNGEEIRNSFGTVTAPAEAAIYNPAFDVTPATLITAIISDSGIHTPPFHFA